MQPDSKKVDGTFRSNGILAKYFGTYSISHVTQIEPIIVKGPMKIEKQIESNPQCSCCEAKKTLKLPLNYHCPPSIRIEYLIVCLIIVCGVSFQLTFEQTLTTMIHQPRIFLQCFGQVCERQISRRH